MNLFISPHNDDEALFGAYTLMRDKPLVFIATLSKRQGDNALERLRESQLACDYLGCPMVSSGIFDQDLTEENLTKVLKPFVSDDIIVYAPDIEVNGHPDHNICGKVAKKLFKNVIYYKTYTQEEGGLAVKSLSDIWYHDQNDFREKKKALDFYYSQINRPQIKEFFTNNIDIEYYAE